MIHGVITKALKVIPDERGFLMEMLRDDDPFFQKFGQVYLTVVYPEVVKGWHYHKKQTDHFVVVKGMSKVVLYDSREDSPTKGEVNEFFLGERNPTLLVIPPPIGRFYFLDLRPGRSFVEYAVSRGQQVFMISWRNPTPEQRDWDADDYAGSILEAIDVVTEITGSEDINSLGFCAGGILQTLVLNHMATVGDERINSASYAVTLLDFHERAPLGVVVDVPQRGLGADALLEHERELDVLAQQVGLAVPAAGARRGPDMEEEERVDMDDVGAGDLGVERGDDVLFRRLARFVEREREAAPHRGRALGLLTSDQIIALTTDEVRALTTTHVQALSSDQFTALLPAQVAQAHEGRTADMPLRQQARASAEGRP